MALIDKLKAIADAIREKTGFNGPMTLDEMADMITNIDPGSGPVPYSDNTFILVDDNGIEVAAYLSEEEVPLTATTNDIRMGTTAVIEEGVVTGEKEIPAYYVTEGYRLVSNGALFTISVGHYDYSKLQAVFCKYNTTLNNSVYTDRVSINNSVYDVMSTNALTSVVKDFDNKCINFGFTNDSGSRYLIRYFLFKEVD
jgi:hypothetical protein